MKYKTCKGDEENTKTSKVQIHNKDRYKKSDDDTGENFIYKLKNLSSTLLYIFYNKISLN